jgi:hypothetical protein
LSELAVPLRFSFLALLSGKKTTIFSKILHELMESLYNEEVDGSYIYRHVEKIPFPNDFVR